MPKESTVPNISCICTSLTCLAVFVKKKKKRKKKGGGGGGGGGGARGVRVEEAYSVTVSMFYHPKVNSRS